MNCPTDSIYLKHSLETNFGNYLEETTKNDDKIEIYFYSNENDSIYTLKNSLFSGKKVTLKSVSNSRPIKVQYEYSDHSKSDTITIRPDHQVNFPDLFSYHNNKIIEIKATQTPVPTPEAIPISIGVGQMEGPTANCPSTTCTESNGIPNSPNCGKVCTTTSETFSYTFTGVQFVLVGSSGSDYGPFQVVIDSETVTVNKREGSNIDFDLIYTSNELTFGEHTVQIKGTGNTLKFYKLMYWPAFKATRVNISDFTRSENTKTDDSREWKYEPDNVNGIRYYMNGQQSQWAKTTITCTRFWIYGSKCSWNKKFKVSFGDISNQEVNEEETISGTYNGAHRKDFVLLYDSGDFASHSGEIRFDQPTGSVTFNCIFYLNIPSPIAGPNPAPTPETIPISIPLTQLKPSSGFTCNHSPFKNSELPNLGCSHTDFESPTSYQCGFVCKTNSGTMEYTFKGVQFALLGTYESEFGEFIVEIDGEEFTVNENKNAKKEYALVYTSEVLLYDEHTVKIKPKNQNYYELYKLVYWPDIHAKRINITELQLNNVWEAQTDGIGGVRAYTKTEGLNNPSFSATTKIRASRLWIYGTICNWHDKFTLNYNTITNQDVSEKNTALTDNDKRLDCTLVYESPIFYDNMLKDLTINVGAVTVTINCIYYVEDPIPVSIRMPQMNPEGAIDCNYAMNTNVQNIGCSANTATDQQCGFVCTTNYGSYEYTFKGVKFALYGFYSPAFFKFDLIIDDGEAEEINEYKKVEQAYSLIYTSRQLNYGDHTVKIKGKGEPYKLYKLVFWPSTSARRINLTEFSKSGWKTESDGIGGIRSFVEATGSQPATKEIRCSKYWIYGTKGDWHRKFKVEFNGIEHEVDEQDNRYNTTTRNDNALVFETQYFILTTSTMKFTASSIPITINCVYYIDDEPPPATPVATPSISPTPIFSPSYLFSRSEKFTLSDKFSNSDQFSQTKMFSKSNVFSETKMFSKSSDFSETKMFSKSNDFTMSNKFNPSDAFTKSSIFTESAKFSSSNSFSKSALFSSSNQFSESEKFKPSDYFTKSFAFSKSNEFSETSQFSKTNEFTSTKQFSQSSKFSLSNDFTKSDAFNPSDKFSSSDAFSKSNEFVATNQFSKTNEFSNTKQFSHSSEFSLSNDFTKSDAFNPSDKFSSSNAFSKSNEFSSTNQFSKTNDFSSSNQFSQSSEFSLSNDFTKSNAFNPSNKFSSSDAFSKSNEFIATNQFSKTNYFSETSQFSKTNDFSSSNQFSQSSEFSLSNDFTKSDAFNPSDKFSSSDAFSKSNEFVATNQFSKTNDFSSSNQFSQSSEFSLSNDFTKSDAFNPSDKFSSSDAFSKSNEFVATNQFSKTNEFSETSQFSKTNEFSNTKQFSHSSEFSLSNNFTKSDVFSHSDKFSSSNAFSKSNEFSETSQFSKTNEFSGTKQFSHSSEFSLSNNFTNSNIFSHSDKFSSSDAFSKSNEFVATNQFSKTNDFSSSNQFSQSSEFSLSNDFTKSDAFSNTNAFSKSNEFSSTKHFSETNKFSNTNQFSYSSEFSLSNNFTKSSAFSKTSEFSGTKQFSETNKFSNTNQFSYSSEFSLSNDFTKSDAFSNTNAFSKSNEFSGTKHFSETNKFSNTNQFSYSSEFSLSNNFTKSDAFSNTNAFSKSNEFSSTKHFSETNKFSNTNQFSYSSEFSLSNNFTKSSAFSNTNAFSKSNEFSGTKHFSETNKFSNTNQFSYSSDFSLSNNFTKSSAFSNTNAFSKTNLFSNTNKFSETNQFSETYKFSYSNQFSHSYKFSLSNNFTKSNAFSSTKAFSNTYEFSGTTQFTKTCNFSYSNAFSNTNHFSTSFIFSKSAQFSLTNDFTKSTKFTESAAFTKTNQFSPSAIFSESSKFSSSQQYTKSIQFSESHHFSLTNDFSNSNYFSQSEGFTNSEQFTPSATLIPNDPSCIIMGEDGNISQSFRCDFSDFEGKNVTIDVVRSNFTNYIEEENGGAIHVINCGVRCNGTEFIDCESINGGGGGIYIKNNATIKQNITLINILVLRCKSNYGGGAFLYCGNKESGVLIKSCTFQYNEARLKRSDNHLFGGGSVFLTALNSEVIDSKFEHSKGVGGFKIYDILDELDSKQAIKQLEEENNNNLIIFSGCQFDNEKDSSNSIDLVSGKIGSVIDVIDCNFKGKLINGAHYIDGKLNNKDSPKINIKSCSFDYEINTSVNTKLIKEISSIKIMKNLEFIKETNKWKKLSCVSILAACILILYLSFIKVKRIVIQKDDNHFDSQFSLNQLDEELKSKFDLN